MPLAEELSRAVAKRSQRVGAALCAVVAAAALGSGCSSALPLDPPSPAPHSASSPPSGDNQPAVDTQSSSSVVKHWGSFFGARQGNYDIQTAPVAVTLPGEVTEVGSSNSTEYALLSDGRVYAWGMGNQGQLGDGGTANSFTTPVRVRFPDGIKIASLPTDAMPFDAGLAVDTHGHAWGWGADFGGEFCLGKTGRNLTPVQLPFARVTAIAGASNHAVYDDGGVVYACGQNVDGDLGTSTERSTDKPVRVAVLPKGSVTRLVASFANSGALLSNGAYYDWGYNGAGQLGIGHKGGQSNIPVRVRLPKAVAEVAQGGSIWRNGQTLVKLSDGSLWGWGNDSFYQLGDRTRGPKVNPVRFHAPAGVTYVALATGSATSYAISTTGTVYAWGVSHVGQLGDQLTDTAIAPVQVAEHAIGISSTANNVVISVRAGS
jgi:alpha-tubulin suppressor-like RCC1 family protein